jgi:hypothetical protein
MFKSSIQRELDRFFKSVSQSDFYDCLNQITIDAQLAPLASGERDLLMLHMDKIKSGDMLLLDRGYPCFWLLFLLKTRQVDFCVRLKDNWWLKVKDFAESNEKERIVTFRLPKKDRGKLSDYPQMPWPQHKIC